MPSAARVGICCSLQALPRWYAQDVHVFSIDPRAVRDISPLVLEAPGRPKVVPAQVYRDTTVLERARCGVAHAIYSFPTVELVDRLRELVGDRSAIEIGAGHGALAQALGIPATDNRMQDDPSVSAYYAAMKQPTVRYGPNVEKLDALAAIEKYRPQVVIGCWITHKFDPTRPEAEGNQYGIDEERVIEGCETYIMVGNTHVHRKKPIWALPHHIEHPDFVFSRAANGSPDFIAVWGARHE